MKFVNVSRDPNGVYVALDKRGWLWYYLPALGKWAVYFTGETEESEPKG